MVVEVRNIHNQDQPVCTSLDIANTFGKLHKNVLRDISELGCSDEFRELNFEEGTYSDAYGRSKPMYYMTRDGFTLLVMGYTGDKAMRFKEAYIKAFNKMAQELLRASRIRDRERERGIAARRSLTDSIQESNENERMHGHAYSTYTNAIYTALFGMNAKKLRSKYNLDKKDNLRDCLTADELASLQKLEKLVGSLIDLGWEYARIKEFIMTDESLKMIAQSLEQALPEAKRE